MAQSMAKPVTKAPTIPGKLKIIQRLTGQSQEKLALALGVSFVTFNSWINGKSTPRPRHRAQIEEMYLDYTGQKVIPDSQLAAKKQKVIDKSRGFAGILETILENPDIKDQFTLSLTYHTNRIEGSTLTEAETSAVLFQGSVLPDKNLVEHLEVKNHQAALLYLFNHFMSKQPDFDELLILTLHSKLMNGIRPDAGEYRSHGVRIVGADIPAANYIKVPYLVSRLIENINRAAADPIAQIAEIHSRFEQIHPFSDGNGRIGRLLINAMAFRQNLPPTVIRQEKKRLYYTYLNKAQKSQHNDLSLLEDFLCDAFFEGFDILERKDNVSGQFA